MPFSFSRLGRMEYVHALSTAVKNSVTLSKHTRLTGPLVQSMYDGWVVNWEANACGGSNAEFVPRPA